MTAKTTITNRIISLLLTLVLTAGSLPVAAWAQEPLSWTAEEKTLELDGAYEVLYSFGTAAAGEKLTLGAQSFAVLQPKK